MRLIPFKSVMTGTYFAKVYILYEIGVLDISILVLLIKQHIHWFHCFNLFLIFRLLV